MKTVKKMGELKKYYNRSSVVQSYEKKRFIRTFAKLQHDIELEIINRCIGKFRRPKVLEIAVGTGRVTRDIKAKGLGIDSSEKMIEYAKKAAPGWKFIKKDIMKMNFKNRFDVVVTLRLLRHFNKKTRMHALVLINNSLKKNGMLVFDMPTGKHSRILKIIQKIKPKDEIFEDNKPYDEIKTELNATGFEVVGVYNSYEETVIFKSVCMLNDFLKFLYPSLKKHMDKSLLRLDNAANVVLVAKKSQ